MSIGSSKAAQPITAVTLPLPTGAAADGADITTPTAMPAGGAGIRGWLSAIWTKLNGSLAVTGTFWQATQPISGTVTVSSAPTTAVTGTFFQGTQPVSIAGTVTTNTGLVQALTDAQLRSAAVPVSNTQLPAALAAGGGLKVEGIAGGVAQPVSMATNTPDVTDRAARLLGVVASIAGALPAGTNTIGAVTGPAAAPLALDASLTGHSQTFKSVTVVTALSTANATVTATLPLVAAQFHYITRIRIVNINPTITAIAAAASTLAYTTTNLPGTLAWSAGTLLAAGAEKVVVDEVLSQPIKASAAATNTTVIAPAIGTGGLCRITVYYYTAP